MTDPWEQQLRAFEADPAEIQRFMDRLVYEDEMEPAEAEALRRAGSAPGEPSGDPTEAAFDIYRTHNPESARGQNGDQCDNSAEE